MSPYNVIPSMQWPFLAIVGVAVAALALSAQLQAAPRRWTLPTLGAITPLVLIVIMIVVRFWRAQPGDMYAPVLYYSLRAMAPVLLVSAALGCSLVLSPWPQRHGLRYLVGFLIGIAVLVIGTVFKTFG